MIRISPPCSRIIDCLVIANLAGKLADWPDRPKKHWRYVSPAEGCLRSRCKNNSFPDWAGNYNNMLAWVAGVTRTEKRWTLCVIISNEGKLITRVLLRGERRISHGTPAIFFPITIRKKDHPITSGNAASMANYEG